MFGISEQGWGEASVENIYAVLNSVRTVFAPCFEHNPATDHLFVGYGTEYPVSYPSYGVILLSVRDRCWVQYAYQFAHEYCHFLIGGNVPRQLRWFEESICELASYYFLPLLTNQWSSHPPYVNWASYAPVFKEYVEINKRKIQPFSLDFVMDTQILNKLIENEYDRPKNAYVAQSLLPIFSDAPTLWSVVPYLNKIPSGITFIESLRCWHDLVPEKYRKRIADIAEIFCISL